MSPESDDIEWARALAGRGESFGVIFDRHRDRVYRHSIRLVPVMADVDDVVAMTFFEAWRRRDRVHFVEGSMLPWLLVTATNLARNVARGTRRYRALLERLPFESDVTEHPIDDEGIAHDALRKLDLRDQQVITVCVLLELSEREAAEVLGVAPGTVKSRLSRAKARLRAHLNDPSFELAEEVSHVS